MVPVPRFQGLRAKRVPQTPVPLLVMSTPGSIMSGPRGCGLARSALAPQDAGWDMAPKAPTTRRPMSGRCSSAAEVQVRDLQEIVGWLVRQRTQVEADSPPRPYAACCRFGYYSRANPPIRGVSIGRARSRNSSSNTNSMGSRSTNSRVTTQEGVAAALDIPAGFPLAPPKPLGPRRACERLAPINAARIEPLPRNH
jgi:hypothetical protein